MHNDESIQRLYCEISLQFKIIVSYFNIYRKIQSSVSHDSSEIISIYTFGFIYNFEKSN